MEKFNQPASGPTNDGREARKGKVGTRGERIKTWGGCSGEAVSREFTSQTCSQGRKPSPAVPLRLDHVVLPRPADAGAELLVDRARHPPRHPHHAGAGSDERGRMDVRYCLTGGNCHCTHASAASPFFWAGFQRRFFAMSTAASLNVATLEPTKTLASRVRPSRETLISRIAGRGVTGASAPTGMKVGVRGMGRVSKQMLSVL